MLGWTRLAKNPKSSLNRAVPIIEAEHHDQGNLHHQYAIKNLDKPIARYQSVFRVKAERLGETDFAFPGLAGARLNVNGFYITLITSSSEDTSMARFLEKKG
ncbi:MAG: hypothetical protein A3H27_05355 [Acidobacteria bacterium RIFCSPLOWO2_02_FULL_59_13]|nr:MAG: hypothetical protein A3H27_05355 [Acidobacteria bacterium RIFCSPLOWO2_02_FULL_59_13]